MEIKLKVKQYVGWLVGKLAEYQIIPTVLFLVLVLLMLLAGL